MHGLCLFWLSPASLNLNLCLRIDIFQTRLHPILPITTSTTTTTPQPDNAKPLGTIFLRYYDVSVEVTSHRGEVFRLRDRTNYRDFLLQAEQGGGASTEWVTAILQCQALHATQLSPAEQERQMHRYGSQNKLV